MKKLAIIISHPIQYYAPLFQLLALQCELMVFYTFGKHSEKEIFDEGFKKKISWDLPLLENYNYYFVENKAKIPGHYFNGIKNPTLINDIRAFQPHAILIYGWSYRSHLKAIRSFKGKVPVWFRGDSTLLDPLPFWKKWIKDIFLNWVYRHLDLAFFVGQENKSYFKRYGLKENKLIFAPHAVDNERFSEDRSTEAIELRQRFGISNEEILILFAGKFEAKKDPVILLEAFIKSDRPLTHLLFVGNGELEKSLKLKVNDLGKYEDGISTKEMDRRHRLAKRIHFMDFQNQTQMPVVYQTCDLFCLPSKGPNETWGLAVSEAMASGKAILVSDKVGCTKDLVSPENGYIFKSRDLTEITGIINILEKKKLTTLGKASLIKASSRTIKNIIDPLIKHLYKNGE